MNITMRSERLVPLVLFIAVLVAAILSITPWPIGAYEDDAIYAVLAKSLASGEGYRMLNLPGAPHATHYPPGYPFVLSLLWRMAPEFPDNVVIFKFANAVFLAIAALGMYWFIRPRLGMGSWFTAAVAAVGAASIPMLHLAGLVLSEPLFVALLFLALILADRTVDEGGHGRALTLGLVLGALTMVRTIGAMAIPAVFAVLLLRRRYSCAMIVAATAAVCIAPWQMWVGAYQGETAPFLVGKYGAYWPWMVDGYKAGGFDFARAVVLQNMAGVGNTISYWFMPSDSWWFRALALVALVPMVITGLLWMANRSGTIALFFLFYFGVIIIWPFDPQRFLIALWPCIAIIVSAGAMAAWKSTWRSPIGSSVRYAALAGAAYLAVGHAAYNVNGYRDQSWTIVQQRAGISARPLVEWVYDNTQPDDVLSTEDDVVVYLYTGRRGIPNSTFLASQRVTPFTADDFEHSMESMLTTFEPRYLVTGYMPHLVAADSLALRTPPMLRKVGDIRHHRIYERLDQP